MKTQDITFDFSIIEAIKKDHEDLKDLITILKDSDKTYSEKKKTFPHFAALLKSHAKSEETAVYVPCLHKTGLKDSAYEGYEEHYIADELIRKIQASRQKDQWMARVKVLAELVEHHIKEEEDEFLPQLEKSMRKKLKEEMVEEFVTLRKKSQTSTRQDNAGVLSQIG